MRTRRLLITLSFLLAASAGAHEPLTLEMIFGEDALELSGAPQSGFEWISDSVFLWPRTNVDGELVETVSVDASSGEETVLLDVESVASTVDETFREDLLDASNWIANPEGTAFLIELGEDIWIHRVGSESLERLTKTDAEEETIAWSPDGKHVSFTRDHDLWILDPEGGDERRLTTTGSETRLNGVLDWVYQEEIYGRGNFKGYWWSDDSRSIAYLSFDETDVDTFLIVDQVPYLQDVETMRYPKAGTDNPGVSLHILDLEGDERREIDLGHEDEEILVVDVSWSPDHEVWFQVQNRTQTWLELWRTGREGGDPKLLIREESPAWVDVLASPHHLPNDTFLWESERDGWRHLYQYSNAGELRRQITSGEWEVRDYHGTDWAEHRIYFSATEKSPIGLDVYRIRVDGSGKERLSERRGWHEATFNPSNELYLDQWSNIQVPPQVRLHDQSGKVIRVVDENPVDALETVELLPVRFVTVPDGDGFEMESMLIEPDHLDDEKQYPVYHYIYGGPHAQQVVDRWRPGRSTERYLFHQFLAQNGIGVWILDNRTASGKGAVATREVYRRFGENEMEDVEDGLSWLRSLAWVDPERIMISGWSYGGF
ncbi:MAG: DPP IV N-terminal domain-containing protein, partial [Thermoanaerobaculia bacterium]|nr:DPP IV N-terminal domain-containing protein [Thermoanaerobaculia bacterium]